MSDSKQASSNDSSAELKKITEKNNFKSKLFGVIDHINNVNACAEKLAERIIDSAENDEDLDFARQLIQRTRSHDLSKFSGIEWDHLHDKNDPYFGEALKQHHATNQHHPEHYPNKIQGMSDLDLAEMVCDWASRSSEMGTDLRQFVKEVATKKYNFSLKSKVYKKIKYYLDLLLVPKFN